MIVFTQDLLDFNPAYNDSIVKFGRKSFYLFQSATKAIVTVNGTDFVCLPYSKGNFIFNFKEVVKSIINTNKFDDPIIPNLNQGIIYSDSSVVKQIKVTFKVFYEGGSESVIKYYNFYRGVEQLPNYHMKTNISQPVKVLLPSYNYVDYHAKYFEGFPFDFGIYGLKTGDEFYFKNITTNLQTNEYTSANNHVKRIFISDGANNTTDTDILVNSSTLNKIELWVNNTFKSNIYLTKVESNCGVYLKWLNSKGTYSYWRFNNEYKSVITPKTIDDFQGSYDNLQNTIASDYLIGKTGKQTLSLDTSYNNEEGEYLADLAISPNVQIYVHQSPFNKQQAYDFIGVKVSDSPITIKDTKTGKMKLSLSITLPSLNTITN